MKVDPGHPLDGGKHHFVDKATYCLASLVLLAASGVIEPNWHLD